MAVCHGSPLRQGRSRKNRQRATPPAHGSAKATGTRPGKERAPPALGAAGRWGAGLTEYHAGHRADAQRNGARCCCQTPAGPGCRSVGPGLDRHAQRAGLRLPAPGPRQRPHVRGGSRRRSWDGGWVAGGTHDVPHAGRPATGPAAVPRAPTRPCPHRRSALSRIRPGGGGLGQWMRAVPTEICRGDGPSGGEPGTFRNPRGAWPRCQTRAGSGAPLAAGGRWGGARSVLFDGVPLVPFALDGGVHGPGAGHHPGHEGAALGGVLFVDGADGAELGRRVWIVGQGCADR